MPEVIIKYEDPEILKVLEELSVSMNFKIANPDVKKTDRQKAIDAITVPANSKADIAELSKTITGMNLDAKKLRDAWRRPK